MAANFFLISESLPRLIEDSPLTLETNRLGSNPGSALASYVSLGKLLNFSVSQSSGL